MSKGVKEEKRVEKIIRGLLKLPENKRCINCNSLGPQYVCMTFSTFVCTTCSGVHREFTHRVKSVSMAKFSAEEVSALEAGGNERARQIYFKAWDPQRNSVPDDSNLHAIRNFIKQVYVERKYTGDKNNERSSMIKSLKDDLHERHSFSSKRSMRDELFGRDSFERTGNGSKEELYECQASFERSSPRNWNDTRNMRYYTDEKRSPRYVQPNGRSNSHRSRLSNFEIVDDRFRDDGTVKKFTYRESRAECRSLHSQKNSESSSSNTRSLKDVLRDKVLPRVIEPPPKANEGRGVHGPAKEQQTAASASSSSTKSDLKETKTADNSSLIDFEANPEPSTTKEVEVQTQQIASSNIKDNGSTPSSSTEKASVPQNINSLEFLLFELSTPAVAPQASQVSSGAEPHSCTTLALPSSNGESNIDSKTNASEISNAAGDPAASNFRNDEALPSFSSGNMEKSISSPAPNPQVPPSNGPQQSSQPDPEIKEDAGSADRSKPNARKELPENLFTLNHTAFPPGAPSWQFSAPHGAGYNMPYHPAAMQMAAFANSGRSSNPFDVGDGSQFQTPQFPSMTPMQGALPNMTASIGLQAQPSHYASYTMNMPTGTYMVMQLPNNMAPPRPQGITSFGTGGDAFASNSVQESSTKNQASFPSAGGNPFEL